MISLPYGGLQINVAPSAQALTTTLALLTGWVGNSQTDADTYDGDVAVTPDFANNRLKINTPGIYLVTFNWSGTGDATKDVKFQLRFNTVAQTDLTCEVGVGTPRACASFCGIINVARATTGLLATFADPTGTFTGKSGAPKTVAPLDIIVGTLASTVNLTTEFSNFNAVRIG
jgi:hypothetical protein